LYSNLECTIRSLVMANELPQRIEDEWYSSSSSESSSSSYGHSTSSSSSLMYSTSSSSFGYSTSSSSSLSSALYSTSSSSSPSSFGYSTSSSSSYGVFISLDRTKNDVHALDATMFYGGGIFYSALSGGGAFGLFSFNGSSFSNENEDYLSLYGGNIPSGIGNFRGTTVATDNGFASGYFDGGGNWVETDSEVVGGGYVYTLRPDDGRVFVAYDSTLRAYDTSYVLQGSIATNQIFRIFIDGWSTGSYIYMANRDNGMSICTYNGSTFSNLNSIDSGGRAYEVWSDGTYIYLANGSDGLRIYEYDGITISEKSHYAGDGSVLFTSVWSDGTYIYVIDNDSNSINIYEFDGINISLITSISAVDPWHMCGNTIGSFTYLYISSRITNSIYIYKVQY